MGDTVGTRLFAATTHFLRGKPMLTEEEVKAMYTLKEYVDRVYRYHRRRASLSSSGRQYFTASNFRPVTTRVSSGSYGSRRSVGLVASHAETDSGLATAAIKGILCAVQPFTELSEYEVSTSVFEKLFGATIAFYWSLHKPTASRIAVVMTVWCIFYSSPLQPWIIEWLSPLVSRFVSMFAVLWIVLFFWSQLNWRMTVTVLGYFDSWFFITQAALYALAIMALYNWDSVVVLYNIFGILGFSAVIAYDAYPLSMRNSAKYMLLVIMTCLIAAMIAMGIDAGDMDRSLHIDMLHGLVHTNCTVMDADSLTWNFNVYDFAIQRLQILAIYMVRNTYWAFNAPRYCVIIKSRVALEEVPVIGVRVMPGQPPAARRNTLVRQSFQQEPTKPLTSTSRSRSSVRPITPTATTPQAPSVCPPTTTAIQPNTGPLYDLHPIQNDAAHVYDREHRMSIISMKKINSSFCSESVQDTTTPVIPPVPHRPPKPSTFIRLPKLSSKALMKLNSRSPTKTSFRLASGHLGSKLATPPMQRIPVKRKSSSVPRNLGELNYAVNKDDSRTGSQ